VNYVTLTGGSAITAPLTGAFTPDDSLFFVATAGDNLVHYITIPQTLTSATPPADSQQIAPNLPSCIPVSAGGNDIGCTYSGTGSVAPVTAIAVKPRSTT
jgi:DNA-binding beta-propeller fold protein YncE